MAKDNRRKTFAADDPKNTRYDPAAPGGQRGRQQTNGTPAIKRTAHSAHQPLRVEKLQDVSSPRPLKLKNHHETIQGQLQAYKKNLASDLENDLSRADLELHNATTKLADTFDEKCCIIHSAGEIFRDHIADEILQVDDQKIMLNEQMEAFKELYQQKETRLRSLWKEYVDVQKQIMELAIVVLNDEDVAVVCSDADKGSVSTREQRFGKDLELDQDGAMARQGYFRQTYQDALDTLVGLKGEVQELTSKALEKNKDIYKAFEASQKKLKATIGSFLDSVQYM